MSNRHLRDTWNLDDGEAEYELTKQTILCKIWLAHDREIGHGQILGDNSGLFQMLFNHPTDSYQRVLRRSLNRPNSRRSPGPNSRSGM